MSPRFDERFVLAMDARRKVCTLRRQARPQRNPPKGVLAFPPSLVRVFPVGPNARKLSIATAGPSVYSAFDDISQKNMPLPKLPREQQPDRRPEGAEHSHEKKRALAQLGLVLVKQISHPTRQASVVVNHELYKTPFVSKSCKHLLFCDGQEPRELVSSPI